jgi:hypothetical protein
MDSGCIHGVPWYVAQLGAHLLQAASHENQQLPDCLAAAIEAVAALHLGTCDLTHPGTPSSTVIIVRARTSAVEHLVLSDSTLILETATGPVVVTDKTLKSIAVDQWRAVTQTAVGTAQHASAVQALVTEQRKWRNVPGGYWLAASNPQAADHAVTGITQAQGGMLLSDGAACLVDTYHRYTWPALIERQHRIGAASIIQEIRDIEQGDPEGQQWARFKSSDDATILAWT